MAKATSVVEVIGEEKILTVRGQRVMLDSDLAKLYGVTTFRLNEAVKRNRRRFPADFMFQLEPQEFQLVARLTSQIAMSKGKRGGRRTLPYAFTEQGVAMLSSVLSSERAIQVNVAIMRAFVRMRASSSQQNELFLKLLSHEGKLIKHDRELEVIFDTLRQLSMPPSGKKSRIGF